MPSTSRINLWVGCVQLVDTWWLPGVKVGQFSHYPSPGRNSVGINTLFSSDFSQVVHTFCAQLNHTILSVSIQLSTLYTALTTSTTKYKKGKN